MRVVSNTSPIIALSGISRIDLLQKLYGEITIPEAVFQEITSDNLPGCQEVTSLSWFIKKAITNKDETASLAMELDTGEAEAITLSLELKAGLLLIDERKGKLVADRFAVKNVGVLGILLEAKKKNLIKAVKPLLDDLF